ncbi:unnamed protein product [Aphanomyces euteiches]|uniref:Uncharacterized protein n=1 Tax=Aphanomyces euteiches TaxID=100861 RepID=A0A6G0X1H1_9STRA|nr:hypothetical protein Ae201684_009302 [Aphanomyces euteiches]KAH9069925.1 hypothetical protein Ae201684P_002300 [Aphanomyces euteiches]KAH9153784.1 hypothetical protein AeRB84_004026 [Aphanomyces euteiches]
MVATTVLDTKGYLAAKDAVHQLKLQSISSDKSDSSSSPVTRTNGYGKVQQQVVREMDVAMAEHAVIVRTSGLRPGRENILIEHIDVLRKTYSQALEALEKEHDVAEKRWQEELQLQQATYQAQVEKQTTLLADREKDMEQWQQELETQHFEELERLTKQYDDKVLEIQTLCETKVTHVDATAARNLESVRERMKEWKAGFEAKVKSAVQSKIEQLQVQSERQLQAVVTQLDKEAHAIMAALHDSRQKVKSLEHKNDDLTQQIEHLAAGEKEATDRLTELHQRLAHEQAKTAHFQQLYETLFVSVNNLRSEHAAEMARLREEHIRNQKVAEQRLTTAHQDELAALHNRVRDTVALKCAVISRLEAQLADATERVEASEELLRQINSDIQNCGGSTRDSKLDLVAGGVDVGC